MEIIETLGFFGFFSIFCFLIFSAYLIGNLRGYREGLRDLKNKILEKYDK